MGATFVVTLREAFEAALLLGIVYSYLDRVGARAQYHWVTLGGVLGLVASVTAGLAVSFLSGPLLDLGPDLVAAGVIFLAVALLTWHSWWMRQHARGNHARVVDHQAIAPAQQRRQVGDAPVGQSVAPALDHQQPRSLACLGRRLGDGRGRQLVVEVREVHAGQCTTPAGASTGGAP